jgi:pyruvate,orthophosphate dikinase
MPEAYEQFVEICDKLENHYRDMQDMEFTIEDKANSTCSRPATASAPRSRSEDCLRPGGRGHDHEKRRSDDRPAQQLDTLLHPQFDPKALKKTEPIGKALPLRPELPAVR